MADLVPVYDLPIPAGWQMLVSFLVENPAAKATHCAEFLQVSTHTVRTWQRNPAFQRYQTWYITKNFVALPSPITHPEVRPVRERAEKLKDEISEYAVEMFDKLKAIAETTENEKLIFEIAKDTMDRAGHGAVRREERRVAAFIMSPELLQTLNKRAEEAKVAPVLEGEVL